MNQTVPPNSDDTSFGAETRPNTTDIRRVRSNPDYWYPVAWARELKPGKTIGTRYAGMPIALVSPADGPIFALEDRCAHRQVPLSKGVV